MSDTSSAHNAVSLRPLAIALDGPASSGKGTVARIVAQRLGYAYVDTGAMYRAVGLFTLRKGLSPKDNAAVGALAERMAFCFRWNGERLHLEVDGEDLTDAIRTEEVGRAASDVAVLPRVRSALLHRQRELAGGGAVLDGRDIGTVVLPNADLKIFLDAKPAVRAQRRHAELAGRGDDRPLDIVLADIIQRDAQDAGRSHAPLRCADDAMVIDSSHVSVPEVVQMILDAVARIHASPR